MNKAVSLILKISACFIIAGAVSLFAVVISKSSGADNSFTERLLKFIETHERKTEGAGGIQKSENIITAKVSGNEDPGKPFGYEKGDWDKYVVAPRYSVIKESPDGRMFMDSGETAMNTYGSYKMNAIYGKSKFTRNKYRMSDDDKPVSRVINDGLDFERQMQLHIDGSMGRRMKVFIDYDSDKEDNRYSMQYKAINDDEIIREINAGEIDIKFKGSKYAVYDDTSSKGLGLDLTLRKNNFSLKAFGSIIKGETEIEIFRGNSSSGYMKLADYQYVRNTYYQLEPFKRYDHLTTPPVPGDDPYNTLVTFTSKPAIPETYKPGMVNISPSGFEIYMDDQNNYNTYENLNSVKLTLDGGYYDKLVSGTDYTINYSTGLITFIKNIPKNARIFAVYTLAGSPLNTSDPSARTDITGFSGKLFVFIKYGYTIDEDLNNNFSRDPGEEDQNNDERLNLDIYEVRSIFNVGQKQLLENNFNIQFFKQNGIMTRTNAAKIGRYSADFTNGLIMFYLREPFRDLYKEAGEPASANILYSENQPGNTDTYSKYNLRVDYYREARSLQLKHMNIIPGSTRIKLNGRELPSSLYSVDHTSGFLQFTNPNNPAIGPETDIEVKYEYLPFGSQTSSLVTGTRAEYAVNRNLKVGGTVLLKRQSATDIIPKIGAEPEQTLVLEGDASLHMGEDSLKKLVKSISGYSAESMPLEVNAYAEYAKSYKKVNTFGKALIDDMESNEEAVPISLSDKDWQLASMPYEAVQGDVSQSERGLLYYRYYRDPDNAGTLKGPGFTPYNIPYAQKPGPYTIAEGHIADSIQDQDTQKSLAFNFDFSTGSYIPVVTRQLSSEAVDLSGLQYIEIWYRADGTSTGEVELNFDLGSLNEDADGDGFFDTEDLNNNNILDFDPSKNSSEDVGWIFNPAGVTSTRVGSGPGLNSFTTGDGILNTEDLDRNGTLDTKEARIRMPGAVTTPYNETNALAVDMADSAWKKARIYLDKSSADYLSNSYKYEELLKKIESIRFFLRNSTTNPAGTGTIYIDSIKFISTIWGNLMLDDFPANSPNEFSLTLVDSINDEEYRANSFMIIHKSVYNSLYGDKSDDELAQQKETAIQIDYNLAGKKGSATKKLTKSMDIRSYKTMNVWFNFRNFTPGDTITILVGSSEPDNLVGSSEGDYMEYRFPMDYPGIWREMKLKLKDGSSGNIEKYAVHGSPDLKRISFIRVEVNSTASGKLWLNDIYLSEAESQTDSAYWYEGEIKIKRPLLVTDAGTPVFSDINLKYISKGHGSKFSTLGQPMSDIMEQYNEIFSSTNILPNWSAKLDFILENSETDSFNELVSENKRGKTEKKSLLFESNYVSNIYAVPSIKLLYKQDMFDNKKEEDVAKKIIKKTGQKLYTPSVILDEKIHDFLYGNLSGIIKIDLSFKNEKIIRDNTPVFIFQDEIEKRQAQSANFTLEYKNKYFYIQPGIFTSSQEIVKLKGKTYLNDTQILADVENNWHFPFLYNSKYKFVDREKKTNLRFGSDNQVFSPNTALEFFYSENNFRDYSSSERLLSMNYSRARNARSSVSNSINLPFNFGNHTKIKFLKYLNFNYTRSVYFQETDIPFEGEGTGTFEEEYGIKRVYGSFADPVFNLWNYPPWHFYTGRGNFARGRDFSYNTLNSKLKSDNDSPIQNYDNQFRLIDNAGVNSMFDFNICNLNLSVSISEISERQSLCGIPQEVVTINTDSGINFDLMQVFSSGFFRQNRIGIPHHSANFSLGYTFARNMLITSNIEENTHSPNAAITFKRDRSSLGLKTEFNYRQRNKREYISLDEDNRSRKDDIYIENMQTYESFRERDKGYKFSILYETDILWLHKWFSYFYVLTAYPIFSIEYSLMLDRYDYSKTTSPEPYDQHLVTCKLTLDLHKNIQGGLTGRAALERFRTRETNSINREIQSYEITLNFTLLF
ncbi:MAG: hypothetical protein JXN64_04460 [Spirochaetes bacterium]|nr:hypothetical protein [Spirochaetota bacterium]